MKKGDICTFTGKSIIYTISVGSKGVREKQAQSYIVGKNQN